MTFQHVWSRAKVALHKIGMLSLRFCYFLTYIRSIVIIRKRSTLRFLENIHPLNLFSQYPNIFFNSHLLNSEDKKYVTERRFYIKTKICNNHFERDIFQSSLKCNALQQQRSVTQLFSQYPNSLFNSRLLNSEDKQDVQHEDCIFIKAFSIRSFPRLAGLLYSCPLILSRS